MFVRSQAAPLRRQDGFTRPAKVDVSQDMRRGNESEKVRPQGMRAVGEAQLSPIFVLSFISGLVCCGSGVRFDGRVRSMSERWWLS